MKKFILYLIILTNSFYALSQIDSEKFGKNANASISRISLFKEKEGGLAPNVLWAQFDATKRSSIIAVLPQADKSVKIRVLAENTPDAAIESISKITSSIKYEKIEASSAVELAKSIAQIKRSSSVDNFRMITYRMAELIGNEGRIDADVQSLIQQIIKAAVETSSADNKVAEEESKAMQVKYSAELQAEKNKGEIISVLKKELEETKDDDRKKEIIKKLEDLLK